MIKDPHTKEFSDELIRALAAFQLIEDNLKLYIKYSFKLVSAKLTGSVPFRFDGTEYDNAPLERLLAVFRKLSDNDNLIKKLDKIKDKRNFCTHTAITSYVSEEDDNIEARDSHNKELKNISKEAWLCFIELLAEVEVLNKRIMKL